MDAQYRTTSRIMFTCLVLSSLSAGCNQPAASVNAVADTALQDTTIQVETGSGVLVTTSLDLTTQNMGKAMSKSFSPFKHDGQDCGLSMSCCYVGDVELVNIYRPMEDPIEGNVIGIQVSVVALETDEPLFSKTEFSIYNQNETVAFDHHGVKITISPRGLSD